MILPLDTDIYRQLLRTCVDMQRRDYLNDIEKKCAFSMNHLKGFGPFKLIIWKV